MRRSSSHAALADPQYPPRSQGVEAGEEEEEEEGVQKKKVSYPTRPPWLWQLPQVPPSAQEAPLPLRIRLLEQAAMGPARTVREPTSSSSHCTKLYRPYFLATANSSTLDMALLMVD